MKAVVLERFGDVGGLRFETNFPDPELSADSVLVRVRAVALNRLDIWVRKGVLPVKPELPHILGSDVSGVVAETGPLVENVRPGDEVIVAPGLSCGLCEACQRGEDNLCEKYDILGLRSKGGYAEYVAVPSRNVIGKPRNLSFEEAASYPLTFLTAWHALVNRGGIAPGSRLLVWAGSSGVGSAAIQIAKLFSAYVIATAGDPEKMDRCRELGADVVLNHYEEDVPRRVREIFPDGVDMVLDHVGRATFGRSAESLRRGGRLLFLGTTTGGDVELNLRSLFVRGITLSGVYMGRRADLFRITGLFERGELKPVVDRVLPLENAGEAHRYLESSRHFGKVVLRVP